MGQQKKDAKGRLDKYYRLAKDQGYRARSAFKLIQLNNQFSFLQNARCLVDLCAAPGGWCQVAQNVMPKPSIIIGIDLAPIKPIPGVITFVQDITSEKTKGLIRGEIKSWEVDVVLHDGAPNVGTSWLHDAFQQSQLVLHALKLATQFLAKNGTFVTKVFRSKDYNNLLWVFSQLFDRVEATKPPASRAVSAEIFVVCMGYKKPDKIDERLLDLKCVFKEVEGDGKNQASMMNDLMHPEKRKRHRAGYEDGDYTLFKVADALDFIQSEEYVAVLSSANKLDFTSSEASQNLKHHVLTSKEVLESCQDLKVLGKKDFKLLLKWRDQIRISLNLAKPKQTLHTEKLAEVSLEDQMSLEQHVSMNREKKEKKKSQERKAKALQKMNLGMETPMEIGIEAADAGIHSVEGGMAGWESECNSADDSDANSDAGVKRKLGHLEDEMDNMYNEYKARKMEKDPLAMIKEEKKKAQKPGAQEFEEWFGIEYDAKKRKVDEGSDAEDERDVEMEAKKMAYNSDSECEERVDEEPEEAIVLSKKASSFFSNPLFGALNMATTTSSSSQKQTPPAQKKLTKKERRAKAHENDDSGDDFEVVPNQFTSQDTTADSEDDNSFAIKTAAAYTLAQQVATSAGRRTAIDNSFSRHAFHDTDLPAWFQEDESKHSTPNIPVTKDAILAMKERMRSLDARPIKKVAEAKFRKQIRTQKRMDKLKKKADGLADDEENQTKLTDIQKMLNKGMKKAPEKKPTLVVAKGSRKALQGRPSGVKGRYKMVDPRMKKEMRADKRGKKAANPHRRR